MVMLQISGLSYRINRLDEIVAVSPGWDAFATANDGPDVVAAKVLTRPLWHFISDPTTRQLYDHILKRAHWTIRRVHLPLRLP